ncbi:hypothetical protein TBK1r_19460 [Stieleria magnilauensis]|uniref:Uncharacterized protein n=1 Tax=Stieleria magnilauensis TaxID=2527963 RepID=A0ABX5XLZ7_9BACT|nr:hypothetical protein TBK1r_19460 [Planctomycetes bacterium TBK1r]
MGQRNGPIALGLTRRTDPTDWGVCLTGWPITLTAGCTSNVRRPMRAELVIAYLSLRSPMSSTEPARILVEP